MNTTMGTTTHGKRRKARSQNGKGRSAGHASQLRTNGSGRVVRTVEMPPTGSVRADEVLTKAELLRRLRIGLAAFRTMRAEGLRVSRVGKFVYVTGADLVEFMQGQGSKKKAAKA